MQRLKFSLIFALIFWNYAKQLEALLFPASSIFQLTSSVSVPIEEIFPERRLIFDWCFQMNYDLPNNPKSFYSVPIWPSKNVGKRDLAANEPNATHISLYEKYDHKTDTNRHMNDFSAGELYQGIEDLFVSHGFHETCLLKTVCDLARHPFDDQHQNIFSEILTFLLSPSAHQGFDITEKDYRETYEEAEQRGFLGEDCHLLYGQCEHDLLGAMTQIMLLND